jgi:hypothetical protein
VANINLFFTGPYKFLENDSSVFKCEYSESPGIYLWTINTNAGHMVHYIGETTKFAPRQKYHLIQILGLNYGIFDPSEAKMGKSTPLWNGLWRDKRNKMIFEIGSAYEKLISTVIEYTNLIDIFFAEFHGEKNLRKHIEGSIGWNLRNNHLDVKSLYPDDNHVGTSKEKMNCRLLISCSKNILGIDREIDI